MVLLELFKQYSLSETVYDWLNNAKTGEGRVEFIDRLAGALTFMYVNIQRKGIMYLRSFF